MLVAFCLGLGVMMAIMMGSDLVMRRSTYDRTQGRLHGLMAVGGGFTLALVFLEMLPVALSRATVDPHLVLAAALGGIVAFGVADRLLSPRITRWWTEGTPLAPSVLTDNRHPQPACAHSHHRHAGCSHGHGNLPQGAAGSAISCLVTCLMFDGVALGTSLQSGQQLGIFVLAGVLLHALPEGLLASLLALATGRSVERAKQIAIVAGSSFGLGIFIPFGVGNLSPYLLPFAAGTMVYSVITHIVPSAARTRQGLLLAASGGIGFWAIDTVVETLHNLA